MPEGPTIVILKEEVQQFGGKEIIAASGNTKIPLERLAGKKVLAFKSWGKHFLICFSDFTIRIHFLLFGSYLVNATKDTKVRLALKFKNGELNFYAAAVKILEGDINDHYDWTTDVMNDKWNPRSAKKKVKALSDKMICDLLLEQDIFSGVGNIIKNEILYRVKIHPESIAGALPDKRISELVREARHYSFQFLKWKKNYELKKHWLAHTKKQCGRCKVQLEKKYTGTKKRRSFFCTNCQKLYL